MAGRHCGASSYGETFGMRVGGLSSAAAGRMGPRPNLVRPCHSGQTLFFSQVRRSVGSGGEKKAGG